MEKLVKFARMAGNNRVVLLPDCDEEGEMAFKELPWQLNEAHVDVRLGCSSRMFDGAFNRRQPFNEQQSQPPGVCVDREGLPVGIA